MGQLSSSELAQALNVTPGRVSQYVAAGKLADCYQGDGRLRRFDLEKVLAALGRGLDRGQMLGNGAGTRRAMRALADDAPERPKPAQKTDAPTPGDDPDAYAMVRTAKIEEELRRLRRENALLEGTLILKSEAERQIARRLGQEIREVESVLREAARHIADRMGVDFKAVRQILTDDWREHRRGRAEKLSAEAERAETAGLSADEALADI